MEIEKLKEYLETHSEWAWKQEPQPEGIEPEDAILIWNERFDTVTRVTAEAIEKNKLETILAACAQGRNVEQITRVTGYFSKVAGWNKGKRGELKDRHRTPM